MNKKNVKQVFIEYPYSHSVTLRRSGFSKAAWSVIVHKFGVNGYEPENVQSITIEGEDDFGHLQLSVIVEV
jgi:hypothetical protein